MNKNQKKQNRKNKKYQKIRQTMLTKMLTGRFGIDQDKNQQTKINRNAKKIVEEAINRVVKKKQNPISKVKTRSTTKQCEKKE